MIDKIQVLKAIEQDDAFKRDVVKAIMSDDKHRLAIAREVFGVTMQAMGLSIPGTIGDFIHKAVKDVNVCSKKNNR